METLQIRLPKDLITLVDRAVRKGLYRSRSEAVRNALERMQFLAAFEALGDLFRKEGIDKTEVLEELGKIRKQVYKKYL